MTAISSTNCGNYSSSTFHVTQYHDSCEVTQVGRCISVCIASRVYRSAAPWYMVVTTVILLWIRKTTTWLRRVCCTYWFCGWWPKKLYNYSAQATPCLWNSHKNILLNSILLEIHFTLLPFLHEDLPLVSLQIIWLKFDLHFSSPCVCHMSCASHLTFDFVILIIFV